MTVSLDTVRARLNYDTDTGVFTLLKSGGRKRAGTVAGYVKRDGYRLISVDGRYYYAHRLAWFVSNGAWPSDEIDHINGVRDDNRISNLRLCSRGQNMANIRKARGWHWHSRAQRWQSLIRAGGKRIFLGSFKTEEEARAAYEAAAIKYHGEFAFIEKPKPAVQEAFDYDAQKDVEGCFNDAYAAIRARVAAGGPGWEPK